MIPHPVVGVSGSSPAYVLMFIEAMADAADNGGMPRAQAYEIRRAGRHGIGENGGRAESIPAN